MSDEAALTSRRPLPATAAAGIACLGGCTPREVGARGERAAGSLVEVTLLILAGLLLAVATVNDVVDQTHVNHRLNADLRTWREYTGHDYKNVSTEQDLYRPHHERRGLRQHHARDRQKNGSSCACR